MVSGSNAARLNVGMSTLTTGRCDIGSVYVARPDLGSAERHEHTVHVAGTGLIWPAGADQAGQPGDQAVRP